MEDRRKICFFNCKIDSKRCKITHYFLDRVIRYLRNMNRRGIHCFESFCKNKKKNFKEGRNIPSCIKFQIDRVRRTWFR